MKNNCIKKSLSVIIISLLMCLVFVSCNSNNKDVSIPDKVVENNQENEEVVSDVEKPVEDENKELTQEENVEVEQEQEGTQPVNQELQDNQENEYVEVVEKEDSYGKIICIVNEVYLSNGKKYIDLDQVEFFMGEEAYTEAGKDGKLYKDESGNDFLPNGYYIRNDYNNIETFEVNEESSVSLCIYIVNPGLMGNASETVPVSYEEFEVYISNSKNMDGRARMFWVNTKNNVVEKIEMQYTP